MIRRDRRAVCALLSCACVVSITSSGAAQETTTYTYDPLGRLTNTSISGGPNNGVSTTTGYDPATNRTNYTVTTTPTPSGPAVANFSFETPDLGNGSASYAYASNAGSGFVGKAGIAANGSAWGFNAAPNGDQVGFVQATENQGGSITLNASGLTAGQYYAVRYFNAQRPGWGPNSVTVTAFGSNVGTYTPASTSFAQVTTTGFLATAASGQIVFGGPSSSTDISTALDDVSIVPGSPPPTASPGTIPNGSFEQPGVGAGFQYNPGVTDNYFGGNSGVAGNGSAWGFTSAPVGTQVGFLQGNNAVIAINVSGLTQGSTYSVKFKAAGRPGFPYNTVYVAFQGNNLGVHTPGGTAFQQFTTIQFTASSATGVLSLSGQTSGDTGTGIDDIQITSP